MKIDLITYSRTRNYGGILQAYGLYHYLELEGYDISFIDYIPERCNIGNRAAFVEQAAAQSKVWSKSSLTKFLFSILRYPEIRKSYKPFLDFMDQRVKFTRPYYSLAELQSDPPKADVYLTGSDQVWNSQFTRDQQLDLPFYLPFVKTGKKISYASSFGKNTIPDQDKDMVRKLISEYQAVSVREKSGQEILSQLGIDAEVVVDPTILCPSQEWEAIASPRMDQDYLLLYQVRFNRDIYAVAKDVANRLGKKLIIISLDSKERRWANDHFKVSVPVEDWMSYIKYADGVITDSFHASVFSILFETPFVVNFSTRKGMSTRISNLLDMTGLNKQCVNTFESEAVWRTLLQEINWDEAHLNFEIQRKNSIEWLKNALEHK